MRGNPRFPYPTGAAGATGSELLCRRGRGGRIYSGRDPALFTTSRVAGSDHAL